MSCVLGVASITNYNYKNQMGKEKEIIIGFFSSHFLNTQVYSI